MFLPALSPTDIQTPRFWESDFRTPRHFDLIIIISI